MEIVAAKFRPKISTLCVELHFFRRFVYKVSKNISFFKVVINDSYTSTHL